MNSFKLQHPNSCGDHKEKATQNLIIQIERSKVQQGLFNTKM